MARKRTLEEPESNDRWLVSYADFITLLFAFFTVLYATSNQDIEKAKKFEDSIKKAFVNTVTESLYSMYFFVSSLNVVCE